MSLWAPSCIKCISRRPHTVFKSFSSVPRSRLVVNKAKFLGVRNPAHFLLSISCFSKVCGVCGSELGLSKWSLYSRYSIRHVHQMIFIPYPFPVCIYNSFGSKGGLCLPTLSLELPGPIYIPGPLVPVSLQRCALKGPQSNEGRYYHVRFWPKPDLGYK